MTVYPMKMIAKRVSVQTTAGSCQIHLFQILIILAK
jgi:hypothetical protein